MTDTGNLINLVTGTRKVPEVIGKDMTVDNVVAAMEQLLSDPTQQQDVMNQTMDLLGRGGEDPGLRAARAVLSRL